MVSRTSFAFCGLVLWNLASARNSRTFSAAIFDMTLFLQTIWYAEPPAKTSRLLRLCGALCGLSRVAFECAGCRELAELVTDHVLRHVHGDKLAAVVDGNGVANHVRKDRRAARPGAHNLLVVSLVHDRDLRLQMLVDERTLLS